MFVHGANGRNEAGVEKRLHALAELLGGAFGGTGNFGFKGLAARLASRAVLRIERGERRCSAVLRFAENGIHLRFGLPLERRKGGVNGALHQGLHFGRARIQFQQRLLHDGLRALQEPLIAPVHSPGGCPIEF